MRAQCCICSDLFESSNECSIAATPCGHVFHEHCLATWLFTSSSCPSCRSAVVQSAVIPKLFFTIAEEDSSLADPEKLSNELQTLRTQLSAMNLEKSNFKTKMKEFREKLKNKEEEMENVRTVLQQEQNTNAIQQQMLEQFETQQKVYKKEREEFIRTQKKLEEYKHVDLLVKGSTSQSEELLQQYSGSSQTSIQQLVKYTAILKREYENLKVEKRDLKEQVVKLKKTAYAATTAVSELKEQVKALQEQLAHSEEDLKEAEKAGAALKAKVAKLQYSKHHPAKASGSFLETPKAHNLSDNVFLETPKIYSDGKDGKNGFVTPILARPPESVEAECKVDVALDQSFDLFEESPRTQVLKSCVENNMKRVRITSAASANKASKRRADPEDIMDSFPLSTLNILKKREKRGQLLGQTVIRKDYNGFGGTSSFAQPIGPPKFAPFKTSKAKKQSATKKTSNPSLPTLDGFLNLV